jgi:multidrug efflux pump subunit AcrA (membrane-fusion protein)
MKLLRRPSGRLRLTAVLAIGAATGVVLTGCNRKPVVEAKKDTAPIRVQVAAVQSRQVQRVVESVGTLYPFDETIVAAEVEGRVLEVVADLGDSVSKGQPLVRISDEEQKYVVAQNEAQLQMAMERLGLTSEKDRLQDVRETSDVRRAQADLTEAEQRYKRLRSLVDQGIGSQQELDQASQRYKAAQAAYDQAVNNVRNVLREVDRSRASLDLQRKKLRDTTVYAPFAGRVKERQVTPGSFVRPNTPLMTLVKIDPIRLRLEVPERMAPWVREGQIAQVMVEAFGDREFRGRVWRISPTVDQSKRTFIVEALIDNPAGDLKPGSYAKARVPTNKSESIRVVTARAVNYVLGSNKAYVVSGGTVDARDVKLGDRFGNEVEIVEGLQDGEQVAITQLNRLDTGTRVQVVGDGARPERAQSD